MLILSTSARVCVNITRRRARSRVHDQPVVKSRERESRRPNTSKHKGTKNKIEKIYTSNNMSKRVKLRDRKKTTNGEVEKEKLLNNQQALFLLS